MSPLQATKILLISSSIYTNTDAAKKKGAQQEKHSTAKHTDTTILTCKKSTESGNTKIPNTKTIIQHRTAISNTVNDNNNSKKTHNHIITKSNSATTTKTSQTLTPQSQKPNQTHITVTQTKPN
ncbi:hypothetical protein MTR_5g058225 [Medicago truncatula]|uniref:Uncharacterized protein n=1 Tax=Medicago truncatula TaxID=3880 RepID=A0A072UE00_MEDTR|nr:hypothetical protein MTR_5g058225 [Medicago truncatula]